MSDTQTLPTPSDSQYEAMFTRMAEKIAAGVTSGMAANMPKKKVTFGEYWAKTPFHPTRPGAIKFTRVYAQNGVAVNWETCYDAEAALLNRITRSGRYIDRLVEVIVSQEGNDESVDIRFHNKLPGQQMEMAHKVKNFEHMLQQIVDVQDAEDAEDALDAATRPEPKPRHFGDNKATREARARAGV